MTSSDDDTRAIEVPDRDRCWRLRSRDACSDAHDQTDAVGDLEKYVTGHVPDRVRVKKLAADRTDRYQHDRRHSRRCSPVGAGARANVEHDHRVLDVVDLIQHPPVSAEPRTMDASEFVGQRLTDSLWILQQRAGDEFHRRCGNIVR